MKKFLLLAILISGCGGNEEQHIAFQAAAAETIGNINCMWDKKHRMCVCGVATVVGKGWFLESLFHAPNHACPWQEEK